MNLAAKITALELAKATKQKQDNAAATNAASMTKCTRGAARKQELWALYTQLAQLQESDEEEDNCPAEASPGAPVRTVESSAPPGKVDLGKAQQILAAAGAHHQPVGGSPGIQGGQDQHTADVGRASPHQGGPA
ncbi:UNVERIFIED_CONTAM: hypothetical protein K2H54_006324 [Gekko kuhli]